MFGQTRVGIFAVAAKNFGMGLRRFCFQHEQDWFARMMRFSSVFAALLLFLAVVSPVSAQNSPNGKVLARIGDYEITETEVDAMLFGRRAFRGLSQEERRDRMLRTLIAEYRAYDWYIAENGRLSDTARMSLGDARRQVMFQMFAESRFTPPEVTKGDIDAFVRNNPHLFSQRRAFQSITITISGGTEDARNLIAAKMVETARTSQTPFVDLNGLLPEFTNKEIRVAMLPFWGTSEMIPQETRSLLHEMVDQGQKTEITTDGDALTITVLQTADALPVEPTRFYDDIRNRIIQTAFQKHREEVISVLSQQVLDPEKAEADGLDENPLAIQSPDAGRAQSAPNLFLPREVRLGAFFAMCALVTLGTLQLVGWRRVVREQAPFLQRAQSHLPILQRPGLATGLTGVLLTLGALLMLGASWSMVSNYSPAFALALLVAGAGSGWFVARIKGRKTQRAKDEMAEEIRDTMTDPEMVKARIALWQDPKPKFWGGLVFLFLACLLLTMVLDLSLGLR